MHTRPRFLTIICVLSYVAGIWSAAGAFSALMDPVALQEATENSKEWVYSEIDRIEGMPEEGGAELYEMLIEYLTATLAHSFVLNLSTLFLSIVSVVGVFFMWRQRKVGFHLYTAANVFSPLIPMFVMGLNGVTILVAFFGMFVSVGFVIMYGLNLKHMN